MKRLMAVLFLLLPVTALAAPRVSEVRLTGEAGHARLELALAAAPDFHVFYLADPYRIVIDMEVLDWQAALPVRSAAEGPVAGLRHGVQKSGATRLVLDLTVPARISSARYQAGANGGKRLVIEVQQVSTANFAMAMDRYQPAKKASAEKTSAEPVEMSTAAGGPAATQDGPTRTTAARNTATRDAAPQNNVQAARMARQVYREPLLTEADAALHAKAQQGQHDPLEYTSPDGYYFSYMRPPGSLFGAGVTVGMQF